MDAFWGEWDFTMDDRGRVSVPSEFRHRFAEGGMLTMNGDGCIELYTTAGYEKMAEDVTVEPRTKAEGRQARRDFYGQSFGADVDRQGRILIPQKLRVKADLRGAVHIEGAFECLELWSPERKALHDAKVNGASSAEQASEG